MKNLLAETLKDLHAKTIDEAVPLIEWMDIDWDPDCWRSADDGCTGVALSPDHSDEECRDFLKSLDFDYDDDYGCQVVYGTIMLRNGFWLEREEYDGAEWWAHKCVPQYRPERQ